MSKLIQWNESLSVNLAEIDEQHQRLFKIINKLIALLPKQKGKNELIKLLNELISYATYHFKTEQDYLEKHPNFLDHLYQHLEFEKKIIGLKEKILLDQEDIAMTTHKTLIFLLSWLQKHIMEHDVKSFRYLTENNLI